jgi:hypothetical protein
MRATLPAPTDASPSATRVDTILAPSLPRPTQRVARAHRLIARVLLGGLALQLFFAGLGVFGITTFLPHMILGTVIVLASLALPIVAWRGHLERAVLRHSWLLVGLMLLQGLLIDLGRLVPVISAIHPANAMLLVLVTYNLARQEV